MRGTVELQLIRETPDLNPVDYTARGVLQELVYREKIRTVQEMQPHIMEDAVKQWCRSASVLCVAANDGHFENLLWMS